MTEEKKPMTEEKRKRGRPRKVTIEELKAAFEPPPTPVNDPVSLDLPALVREEKAKYVPSKFEAAIEALNAIQVAKEKIAQFKKKTEYSPYDNPRFKSKNNLK